MTLEIHFRSEELPVIDGIIVPFRKMPADIVCGLFYELRWGFGCPLDCSYCYLRGTARGDMHPRYRPKEKVLEAAEKAFNDPYFQRHPSIFNTGELSDSLMNPELMVGVADKFEAQQKHKLFTLSKFGRRNIEPLLRDSRKQIICAWSINASEVAKRWEKAAPTPHQRIEAARAAYEAGLDTRVRIDPIFPITNWKTHYEDLLYSMLEGFEPRRIILGTPRGLSKTLIFSIDRTWTQYFEQGERTGWGLKVPYETRREVYAWMYDKLSSIGFEKSKLSLCKETIDMWKELGLQYRKAQDGSPACQCYTFCEN